jgi:predicted regulator of Ras-like GTPase activity (Roadblock/LC7/MglB family)
MSSSHIALSEPDFQQIKTVLQGMQRELDSELVLLIHRSGQQIASEGPARDLDLTSLSSLAAASLAATDGLAQIVGEKEFSVLFQQGRHRSIHISSLDNQYCLVLLFGERVSPGLVRWKVKRSSAALAQMLVDHNRRTTLTASAADGSQEDSASRLFTDEDIDKLFGQ